MRKDKSRRFLLYATVVLAAQGTASQALAQSYPNKPVRMVVGFAPGGGTDVTARLVAQKLTPLLGQTVVVENRTGAAGSIAAENVARSAPDGYTLLMIASTTFINMVLRNQSVERDFVPITLVTVAPLVLVVHPSVPARDVKELITLARSLQGKLNYGSDGVGGTTHLAGELFKQMTKVKMTHVPFKGGAESSVATASGEVDLNFPSAPSAMPLLKAGKFRALAVTSAKRSTLMPSIPTLDESGLPGFDISTWFGLLAPAAVSKDIIAQLNTVMLKVVNTADMKEAIFKQGMEPQTNTPEQFTAYMRTLATKISKVAEASGIKIE